MSVKYQHGMGLWFCSFLVDVSMAKTFADPENETINEPNKNNKFPSFDVRLFGCTLHQLVSFLSLWLFLFGSIACCAWDADSKGAYHYQAHSLSYTLIESESLIECYNSHLIYFTKSLFLSAAGGRSLDSSGMHPFNRTYTNTCTHVFTAAIDS